MKIKSITNNIFNNTNLQSNSVSFRGDSYSKNRLSDDFDKFDNSNNPKNNKNKDKPLPTWFRKSLIVVLAYFTLKNEPFVQNLFDSGMMTEEELDRDEFFEDVAKIRKDQGKSAAFYQVNRLYDIEQPKIEALGYNDFLLEFNLDKQKVNLEINFDENNKDTISGKVQLGENSKPIKYKAVFPQDDIDEFRLFLNDNGKSIILGRDIDGSLYKLENNKKEVLNSKNVEKYEQYLEKIDIEKDWEFFTSANPFWRSLHYVLLILLLYQEYEYDKNRRNDNLDKK